MKRIVLAGLGVAALISSASAADLPRGVPYRAPAVVSVYNWTGPYVGIHAGYGWGTSNNGIDLKGGFVGGQVGYNWQALGSPWVFGIEFDSAWADLGTTETAATSVGVVSVSSNANYTGTLRPRVGYAWDRTMVYLTGGLAWVTNKISVNATVGPFTTGISDSQTHLGGTIGAGIEHAITPNLSVKGEYLYTGYESKTYFSGIAGGASLDAGAHTIKAGLNYHFR
jgi:outer membrane immunogenic protein